MKILLDECVPWPMRKLLAGHECSANDLRRIQAAEALIQSAIETIRPVEFRRLEIPT
jgi:hypothetical protein